MKSRGIVVGRRPEGGGGIFPTLRRLHLMHRDVRSWESRHPTPLPGPNIAGMDIPDASASLQNPPTPFRAPPRYWQFCVSSATTIHLVINNSMPEVLGPIVLPIYSYSLIFLIHTYSPFTPILYLHIFLFYLYSLSPPQYTISRPTPFPGIPPGNITCGL